MTTGDAPQHSPRGLVVLATTALTLEIDSGLTVGEGGGSMAHDAQPQDRQREHSADSLPEIDTFILPGDSPTNGEAHANGDAGDAHKPSGEKEQRKGKGHDHRILYYIKWLGYSEAENTWEPEENLLPHCHDALQQYFAQNGGEDKVKSGLKKARSRVSVKQETPKRSVRGRSATKHSTPSETEPPTKRRKTEEPPTTWTPRAHDWTPDVEKIELIERDESGQLQVYIRFTQNRTAKVSIDKVRQHCPVPMLDFFQAHLKFKAADDPDEDGDSEEGAGGD
ncbi:hypothetical protein DV735_g4414, partial [Chaetothyriales sp. CBS 134920]